MSGAPKSRHRGSSGLARAFFFERVGEITNAKLVDISARIPVEGSIVVEEGQAGAQEA